MANPFLSMEEPIAPVGGDASNPFMMADTVIETAMMEETLIGDNPFATSNPFADLAYEPPVGDTVPVDIFSNMDAANFDATDRFPPPVKPTALELSPSEEHKPRRPPPPAPPAPRPLPPETQNLILSVTGQMDFTSSHLLDRIPPTRTPSPVSMRDIHSPEPEFETDLLGDSAAPARPARPPPPQPPAPRPPPPPRPPAALAAHQDDINLFEAPTPVIVKPTKEDILSLYSTKKKEEEKQVDFLSDDLIDDGFAVETPVETTSATEEPTNCSQAVDAHVHFSNIESSGQQSSDHLNDVNMETIPSTTFKEVSESTSSPFADVINDNSSIDNVVDTVSNPFDGTVEAFPTSMTSQSTLVPDPIVAMETGWGESSSPATEDAFDAFSAKFDSTFSNQAPVADAAAWGDSSPAWGETCEVVASGGEGFEAEAFDPFLSMSAPPPPTTPRLPTQRSQDSAEDNFTLVIRPKVSSNTGDAAVPVLAPPPRPAVAHHEDQHKHESVTPPRHEPEYDVERRESGAETPPTPLFDEDISAVLEPFPRTTYDGPGWEMHLRQPNKKKITGQRFWKKVFVRMTYQGDNPVVQLLNSAGDKEPFQELPLQACYSVSDIGAQQFDQFGKIFTVKLQYVFYKERPGVRPGQVTKAERITNKLSQFAAYAIQGDYQGVKEFGSDLRKLGLPVEHAPQVSQLFKLGSLDYEHVKQFSSCVEEALFRLPAHRDRALQYRMEEVQLTAVDELFAEQDASGAVRKQVARVRIFFLGFLGGMPDVELGVNDMRRQGREVVGRHDIIPVATEEWIRVEDHEFHACVQPQQFLDTQIIKFKPPDACYIELMRFRVRPPRNRELPLQLKAAWCVNGNKVELRADVLVPGFTSRRLGQVPCEDVAIRFPIPECWIYLFRVEKHFRYGSVKSAHRRAGKIKGIERLLGAVDAPQESLIEVTSGQAKYEHQHRAVVWRMPRLPKEGQGAYTTHCLVARMALTSFDQVPAELARWATVEFVMPAAAVSRVTVRSLALPGHDGDPPEKYVRYLARHEYKVGIERVSGTTAPAYAVSAVPSQPPPAASPAPAAAPAPVPAPAQLSSDSDSD